MSASKHWYGDPSQILRVGPGFRLADVDARSTPGFGGDKADGVKALAARVPELAMRQEQLFARSRVGAETRRVLLVLQAMDTAGKGGIVKHVVGAVDPQGIELAAFKAPTPEELEHDFLWRIERRVPSPGMIGVFDRSHYEDVLIARVRGFAEPDEIERRYGAINDFERRLADDGVSIVKVMLRISKEEQRERLADRLARPDKHWKFNPGDIDERTRWDDYEAAYQTVFERTSTEVAPWHVVPADRKWYARLAVQDLLGDALDALGLEWPAADYDVAAETARLAAS